MADVTITGLTTLSSIDRAADFFEVADVSDSNSSRKTTVNSMLNITSQPMGLTDAQSPTNKTFDNTNTFTIRDDRLTLQDNSDTTKQAVFQLSGITTGTTRTYTLPDASSTLVDLGTAQTLTNKTLTNPTLSAPTITNPTITVDTISEFTGSNGVTIDGLNIKDSKLNTNNSVVTANITNASVTANKLATGAANATVNTSETTTSTSYTDLATTTDSVTVTIGANGLALVAIQSFGSDSIANAKIYVSFAVSGANTIAASDTTGLYLQMYAANAEIQAGTTVLLTGLNAGSTTFKMKYRVDTGGSGSGTGTFKNRRIGVVPL